MFSSCLLVCSDAFRVSLPIKWEPSQRPDMGYAVNALDPLVEQWTPTATTGDDSFNIDFNVSLPQALQRWKAKDDSMLYEDTNVD
ncbi:hypothetical protein HAX54_030541 [Datura stramonium]|uniref:Uncharacterized protein n=1 Tax=Datura stramonium TaxID=4076 RepID=A0ABS8V7U0_DATST|nr:hypothetical protein [Datura stramonium]